MATQPEKSNCCTWALKPPCQFTSHEWQTSLREHNLVSSMSRRGNRHDNVVAESFIQLLKHERRQIQAKRSDARADIFSYIEMFRKPKRCYGTAGNTWPVEFERHHSQRLTGV